MPLLHDARQRYAQMFMDRYDSYAQGILTQDYRFAVVALDTMFTLIHPFMVKDKECSELVTSLSDRLLVAEKQADTLIVEYDDVTLSMRSSRLRRSFLAALRGIVRDLMSFAEKIGLLTAEETDERSWDEVLG